MCFHLTLPHKIRRLDFGLLGLEPYYTARKMDSRVQETAGSHDCMEWRFGSWSLKLGNLLR